MEESSRAAAADPARLDALQRRLSAPLPAAVRLFAAAGPFFWGLIIAVLAFAGLFALVVVGGTLLSNAQQGPAAIAIAVLCVPMGWEWLWHAMAPRLGVDLVDVLHGWGAHLVLAAVVVVGLLGPSLLATVAERLQQTRTRIAAEIAAAGDDLHDVLMRAESQERSARQDAFGTFWASLALATLLVAPLLCGLGFAAEWLADDPGPPHTFPLHTPRAWWPSSRDNKPLPAGEGGTVDNFVTRYNHPRAWYFVPMRRGEHLRIGATDPGLHITIEQRDPSPFYRIEWTWEEADGPFVAPYTGWYRIKIDSAAGRPGRVQWTVD